MAEHKWMLQKVDGNPHAFWICEKCRSCAGSYTEGQVKPTWTPFLAGTPLWVTADCEESERLIKDYLEKHPDWAMTAEKHRTNPAPLEAPPQ